MNEVNSRPENLNEPRNIMIEQMGQKIILPIY